MINIEELLKKPALEKIESEVLGEFYVRLANTSDLESMMKDTIDDVVGNNVLNESGDKALTGDVLDRIVKEMPFKHKKQIQDEILTANGINTTIFDVEKK